MKFICYNYLPLLADYVFDIYVPGIPKPLHKFPTLVDPALLREGESIFVKIDLLPQFLMKVFPEISVRFVLVTGGGDYEVDTRYLPFLNDDKILQWIGVNISIQNHPKVCKRLIGFAEMDRPCGDQELLYRMHTIRTKFEQKQTKLYISYCSDTHGSRTTIQSVFADRPFVVFGPKLEFEKYLETLNEYKFVLCPRGNGLDTHRFCEVLLMGSVPVVERNSISDLYEKFPCIIVDTFNNVDYELLKNYVYSEHKYKEFENYISIKCGVNVTEQDLSSNQPSRPEKSNQIRL